MTDLPPPAVVQVSTTWTPHSIAGALLATERFLGDSRQWNATNGDQRAFLAQAFDRDRDAVQQMREITSTASRNVGDVNAFLAEHHFDIQLTDLGEGNIYAASILDLLVEWFEAGEVTTVCGRDGNTYPAVRIGKRGCSILRTPDGRIFVELATKSGDIVWLTMADPPPRDAFDLAAFSDTVSFVQFTSTDGYDGVIFPMVSLKQTVDIGWLCGLHTTGEDGLPAVIAQALQQTKLRMNQFGARVESAAAVGVLRGYHEPKPPYVIDAPFVMWITRKNVAAPLFTGSIAYPDWKDPGTLK